MIYVGIDEAGYGPILGPLVVTAARFSTSEAAANSGFSILGARSLQALGVADSKKAYASRQLRRLELPVLAFLKMAGIVPEDTASLLAVLGASIESSFPWYRDLSARLPVQTDPAEIAELAGRIHDEMDRTGCRFEGFVCRLIAEDAFNRSIGRLGSKSLLLFEACAGLVRECLAAAPRASILLDHHGSRVRHTALLRLFFGESRIETLCESANESAYRLSGAEREKLEDGRTTGVRAGEQQAMGVEDKPRDRSSEANGQESGGAARLASVHMRFVVKADALYPEVSLASMCSKYVRELIMKGFNSYWQERWPSLPRTSGYYSDGTAFLGELRALDPSCPFLAEMIRRR